MSGEADRAEAHVICCNDSVEFVVLGTKERAEEKLEELARAYFDKVGAYHWRSGLFVNYMKRSEVSDETVYRDRYRKQCHWHINTVEVEDE